MQQKVNLEKLLDEVTEVTTEYIKEYLRRENYRDLAPLLEHAVTSVVPGSDRALLVRFGCELMGKSMHIALPGMASWEFLNINLLVTDDFFDRRTTTRMGQETIRERWGDEACISLGFILKVLATEILLFGYQYTKSWSIEDALAVLEWATKWQYYSQFQENELAKIHPSKITLEMYMDLIGNATSVGIAGAFELGCILGGGRTKERTRFRDFGMSLGKLLQIRDDLIDYIYDEKLIKKGPFNDLFEKKRRLPLLMAYWEGSSYDKKQIDNMLIKHEVADTDVLTVVQMIVSQKVEMRIHRVVNDILSVAENKLLLLPDVEPARSTLYSLLELFADI